MESNPFFSDKKPAGGLNSGRPVKFNISLNSNKAKNPYLSKSPKSAGPGFIGPLLPNGAVRSNGTTSKQLPTHETSPRQPNSEKQSPIGPKPATTTTPSQKTTNGSANGVSGQATKKPSSVKSCTASLSSLDILKNSYKDESEEEVAQQQYNPNAQPVLIRKKKKSGETSVFDRLKDAVEKKPTFSGNVFERLGKIPGVKSWSGEDSKNFKNENDNWQSIGNPHKRIRDEYDEELDQGRVKKVKHHKNNGHYRDQKHDFQKAHEFNKNQKRWEERKSWNGHYNGKQNGKGPKYFWKNKKHKV